MHQAYDTFVPKVSEKGSAKYTHRSLQYTFGEKYVEVQLMEAPFSGDYGEHILS